MGVLGDFGSTLEELVGTQPATVVVELHSPDQMAAAAAAAELHKMDMVAMEGKAGMRRRTGGI